MGHVSEKSEESGFFWVPGSSLETGLFDLQMASGSRYALHRDTQRLYLRLRTSCRAAVLAIWATKLLLKPVPDDNLACWVEEVGRQKSAFFLVSSSVT